MYSEKPCGITIAACQELADTMHREKRIFQAGTQRRSVPNFQKAVELVHAGKLGTLKTMHASSYVPLLDNTWLPAQPTPARDVVDWNLWLGPAAWPPSIRLIATANGVASGTSTPAFLYKNDVIMKSRQDRRLIRFCGSGECQPKTDGQGRK